MNIPETELAWMAGFLDGEGCIQIGIYNNHRTKTSYFKRRVCVANTDYNSLLIFKNYFGGVIYESSFSKKNPLFKQMFYWVVSTKQSYGFIKTIYPFLKTKKEKAALYISFEEGKNFKKIYLKQSSKTKFLKDDEINRRVEIVNRLRFLNKRGIVKESNEFQYNREKLSTL